MNHPQFAVFLKRLSNQKPLNLRAIDDLIASIPCPPSNLLVFSSGSIACKLFFSSSSEAMDALCFLWRRRLEGAHNLFPDIEIGSSYIKTEVLVSVKKLLIGHVEVLLSSEMVKELEKRASDVEREIRKLNGLLKRPRKIRVQAVMKEEKERLEVELELIVGRLEEFRGLIGRVLRYLDEKGVEDEEVDVLKLGRDLNLQSLVRIHCMVVRECRRLSDGLPIYASRRKL